MTTTDDNTARMTLRIAGVLQEIRDIWAKRLDAYFAQIESLVDGQWLEIEDVIGIIRESRLASREALDGLGNDLSAELVHTSNGVVARYEAERLSFVEEINDLRTEIGQLLSGDENILRREKKSTIRKLVKELMKKGYVNIDKKSRPHAIIYLIAPWITKEESSQQNLEGFHHKPFLHAGIERQ
jgi:hypothetical protein